MRLTVKNLHCNTSQSLANCFRATQLLTYLFLVWMLVGCIGVDRRKILDQTTDQEEDITLNGYVWRTVWGINLAWSQSTQGVGGVAKNEDTKLVAGIPMIGLEASVSAPISLQAQVKQELYQIDRMGRSPLDALTSGLVRYMALRRKLVGNEPLPKIRLILVPSGTNYVVDKFQVERHAEDLELVMIGVAPSISNRSSDAWAARRIKTLAHELVHFRAITSPGFYPNNQAEEAIASLTGTLVEWEISGEDLPDHIVSVDDNGQFEEKALSMPLAQIAAGVSDLHPTLAGSILAQAVLWKEFAVRVVPYEDEVARERLLELCILYSQHPVDFTDDEFAKKLVTPIHTFRRTAEPPLK